MAIPASDPVEDIVNMPLDDGAQRLEAGSDLRRHLASIAQEQRSLAFSFQHTGNERVAGQLFQWALEIQAVAAKLSEIEGMDLNERVQGAQKFSMTLLEAALAGASIGRSHTDKPSRVRNPLRP